MSPALRLRLIAILILASCSQSASRDRQIVELAPRGPTSAPTATTSAPPSASSIRVATTAIPSARPNDLPSVLDGIACGDKICTRGTVCCKDKLEPKGQCLTPAPNVMMDCLGTGGRMGECDESGDCPTGKVCCESFDSGYDSFYECADLPCLKGYEVCGAEAACFNGYSCHPTESEPGGRCHFDGASVSCGPGTQCTGATPVCKWEKGVGTCRARADVESIFDHFECDDHADCGPGYRCVYPFMPGSHATYCYGPQGYDTSYANASIACRKDADCPRQTYLGPWVCKPADDALPGLRVCRPKKP